ncbi:RidA family protein [Kineosporia babensis]|uniref:RidA family protein n=1 Tax=Kineosporia babensis TaxID=499548 RepID=A0A9X1NN49_9ACTN|nr:RidA family protein [Kineosporia babensis]MCD5316191.1 RidA family protein [Kineosporia babensis]
MTLPFSTYRRAGNLVFLSGDVGFDKNGELVAGGLAAETTQTLANIDTKLQDLGLGLADVVSLTCYVTDITDKATMDGAYLEAFQGLPLPTRTTIEVSALPAGLSLEITAVAFDTGR